MEQKTVAWLGEDELKKDVDCVKHLGANKESRKAFEKLKYWSLDTCTNGVPNIARADNKVSRAFWILVTLTGTAFTLEQGYEAFDKFFKHPINVNLKYKSAMQLEFPAVTICNLNPIRYSSEKDHTTVATDVITVQQQTYIDGVKVWLSAISTYAHKHPQLASAFGIGQNTSGDTNGTQRGTETHNTRMAFLRLMADINDTEKAHMGHQREQLLLHCTYQGEQCLISDFHSFWSSHHGNCYTFNHGYDNRDGVHFNSQAGSAYGLKLELNLEQDEYIDKLSEAAGARIVLHKANTMPFPDDMGTFAPPGYLTSIAARLMRIDRLAYPFEDECVNYTREEAHSHSIYSFMYDVNYTKDACLKTCLQAKVIEKCYCADSELPFNATYFTEIHVDRGHHGGVVNACTSDSKIACLEDVEYKFKHGELNCDYCPIPCVEIFYPEKVSLAQWPSKNHQVTLYSSLAAEGAHVEMITNGVNKTMASDNLLKVEVFFDQLNYEHIYQVDGFSRTDLLAALGGVISLFLGLSVVAIFEFFELGVIIVAHCWKSRTNQNRIVTPIDR